MRAALLLLLSILGLAASPLAARASETPHPGAVDTRIRTIRYNPEQVVVLKGYLGYQLMVAFGPDERIENVSIGDSLAWQVTPNHKATILFLKPLEAGASTNMTVVTDQRSYAFELDAGDLRAAEHGPAAPGPGTPRPGAPRIVRAQARIEPADMAYIVRFTYPEVPAPPVAAPAPPPAPPERKNAAYTYTGSRTTLPSVVFDDGQFTYFQWPETVTVPAIFAVGPDGAESLVNYGVREGFVVVEQVAPRFALRNGKEVTMVINDGWRDPTPAATAPKPHDARTAREAAHAKGGQR